MATATHSACDPNWTARSSWSRLAAVPRVLCKQWTAAEIRAECSGAYAQYLAARRDAYTRYFANRRTLADPTHPYKAKDFAAALPDIAAPELADWLPPGERHRHHLSGNSSQMLALGVLGTAVRRDRSLGWWWDALQLQGPGDGQPAFKFEAKLPAEVLGEKGGPTTIDFLARDAHTVVCCECKWIEPGVGACTCERAKPDPEPGADPANPSPSAGSATGRCRKAIFETDAYWRTAADLFELPKHAYGEAPCQLSFAYQAVRNVAAALALAGEGSTAVFALVYDETNPYFRPTGEWPGWPTVLDHTLEAAHPRLEFRARSWQQLVREVPLDPITAAWAAEKHGLR